jgi:hypothetical protein
MPWGRRVPDGRTAAAKGYVALAPALLVASRRRRPPRSPHPRGGCAALTLGNSRPGRHNAPSMLRAQGRTDARLDLRMVRAQLGRDDELPAALRLELGIGPERGRQAVAAGTQSLP